MGGSRNSDEMAVWPTAEISFMDPVFAVQIVYGTKDSRYRDQTTPEFRQALEQMQRDASGWEIAGNYTAQHVIRPESTRSYLIRMLEVHQLRLTNGIGQHLMRTRPTSH